MARRNQRTRAEQRRLREKRQTQREDDAVQKTLDGLVCAHAAAADYAAVCDARLADTDGDLARTVLAASLWRAHDGRAQPLATALADLAAECQRHRAAIDEIQRRLEALADDDSIHDHLDPATIDIEAIRRTLLPESPPA